MNSLYVRSIGGTGKREAGRVLREARFAAGFFDASSRFPLRSSRCGLRYSHIPSFPPSRPNPDSRYPPNPDAASNRFVQLIHTTPTLISVATSTATLLRAAHPP